MKKIITLAIICFALCQDEKEVGQPLNLIQRKGKSCSDYNIYDIHDILNPGFYDDKHQDTQLPFSYSDCIDHILNDGQNYIEKCCYIRLQHQGTMHAGCIPLNQDQYSDIVETQRLIENGDKAFWGGELKNVKVYSIECSASYLKLAFALLLGLLL
jgi:hypothetical protein